MSLELSAAFGAGHLWRGTGRAVHAVPPLATGHPSLDDALGGGWPPGCLLEILVPHPGQGELGLLLPALAALTGSRASSPSPSLPSCPARIAPADSRPVFLIRPPHVPYGPGLVQQGVQISRLLVVMPPGNSPGTTGVLWAMEEILASGTCGAVLAWTGAGGRSALQRLHLAAGQGQALAVLVRSGRYEAERSPAALRLRLQCQPDQGFRVEILRNRFGRTGSLSLKLPGSGAADGCPENPGRLNPVQAGPG